MLHFDCKMDERKANMRLAAELQVIEQIDPHFQFHELVERFPKQYPQDDAAIRL